ncbi:Caspase-13 [Pteropus alecto]|uniref:Caspase-1 n=1 Tax=Pteropus alecto TaxID=9402 RepID=L5KYI5_PTEAL|nr:Caspase-13 [Pteropus alecto]
MVLKQKRKLFIRSVNTGTINGLLDELLEKRVLNQEEMEKVRHENATVMDKARALIDSVIRKGPQASQICIGYICEDDCHLAEVLELSSGPQSGNYNTQDSSAVILPFLGNALHAKQDNLTKLTFPGPRGSLKLCPLETAQRIWKEKSAEIYPIMEKSIRTRLALIICNTEFNNLPRRTGADVDIRDMKTILEDLGYTVDVKENLTASDMTIELKAFAARKEHKTSDSTFLVFMSHGIRDGICGKNYSEEVSDVLEINTIFQNLNTRSCPNLKDKPKVIIIQACRGEENHDKKPLKVLETFGKEILTGLLDGLVEKNVLKLEETEKKKFQDAKPADKAWVLVDSVRQKRHEAGQVLVQTFLNTDKNSTSTEALSKIVAGPVESAESTDTLKLCPHEEFLKLCKERAGEIYPIKERKDRTRLALIICNTEFDHLPLRKGSELDVTGMKELLEGLGYSVDVKEKLTATEMESVLREFAARPEHKSSDSTFLVFMSHGILDGICGTLHSDEKPDVLPYDTIFRLFNNRNCLSLKDKPKVIIVQACRGANRGELWVSDSPAALADSHSQSLENLEEDAVYKTHVEKDFIAFCSSTPHKRLKEDPINTLKLITKNMLDGIFDDLMEKNVLNKDYLQKLGKGVNLIMNETEILIEDVAEKSQMVGKIVMNHVFNTKKQLCSNECLGPKG